MNLIGLLWLILLLVQKKILNDLSNKVPKERICLMDEQLIKGESSLKAFGLVE